MREWLLALGPLALVVYFVLRPDHLYPSGGYRRVADLRCSKGM